MVSRGRTIMIYCFYFILYPQSLKDVTLKQQLYQIILEQTVDVWIHALTFFLFVFWEASDVDNKL